MANRRRFWKILRANLLGLLGVFLVVEIIAYGIVFYQLNYSAPGERKIKLPNPFVKILTFEEWYANYKFRPVSIPENPVPDARPIITFGCSFTQGLGLEPNQTFQYKMAQAMGRAVYNRGVGAGGIQHMLYQLQNEKELDNIKNPEFVIYLFIADHIKRIKTHFGLDLFNHGNFLYQTYELKDGRLERKKYFATWIRRISTVSVILQWFRKQETLPGSNWVIYRRPKEFKKRQELMKAHILQSREEVRKKWPDAKFVIMLWDWGWLNNVWYELEKYGDNIILLYLPDLIGAENLWDNRYMMNYLGLHPTSETWDLLVPKIVEKLNHIADGR